MSLSELSQNLRQYGPFALLGIILFIIFFAIMRIVIMQLTPPPPTQPFVPAFGLLEPIAFSVKVDYPENPQFTIDNIEGRPVTATQSAQVFYAPPAKTRFSYAQTIAFMGRAVGFDPQVERYALTDTEAIFENQQQRLEIDITNFNFTYDTSYETQPELFQGAIIPQQHIISEAARDHLRTLDRYPDELSRGTENIIFLRFEPGKKEPTVLEVPPEGGVPVGANAIEVQLFPPDVGPFPIVTPNFFKSQNFVVLVFKPEGTKVIKSQIKYFERNLEGSNYPLKTGDEAWQELATGSGTIVSGGLNSNQIIIREMFLGYYDPDVYQQHIQPVYVFLGDNNFAAYVPAVQSQYLNLAQ